jgi:hypothetical protein
MISHEAGQGYTCVECDALDGVMRSTVLGKVLEITVAS